MFAAISKPKTIELIDAEMAFLIVMVAVVVGVGGMVETSQQNGCIFRQAPVQQHPLTRILAGMAIWQTLYAFSFTDVADTKPFLEHYRYLSVPVNCVFYIFIVVCTVATFDRYDVSKVTRPCLLKACTLQSGAVAALLYTAALCVNVSMASMDDRLGPITNTTGGSLRVFANAEEELTHLTIWRVLVLVRAVLVGLAWFILSLRPSTDRLSKNLSQSEVTWGDKDEKSNQLP